MFALYECMAQCLSLKRLYLIIVLLYTAIKKRG